MAKPTNSLYHKLSLRGIGPGGLRCRCCALKAQIRKPTARRQVRQTLKRDLQQELHEAANG